MLYPMKFVDYGLFLWRLTLPLGLYYFGRIFIHKYSTIYWRFYLKIYPINGAKYFVGFFNFRRDF